ncbi:hypothetical protein J0818_29235 [Bacillus cereus]|uniref:Uncharacterized protein n=1 Tax=Bacillus mobilis TaxID=2026190 RepID=A0A1Y6A9S4_9BACI|nr:hypothetical protein [Bacillus cereus]MBL3864074.1 hypothetical protein [Bacillus cereus]SME30939.1 hypothetical protein BACERE00185_04120 [Bacillus mobilis]
MKKKSTVLLCLLISSMLIAYYFYQKNQNEEFVRWGDSIHTVNTEILKENDIEYKIENDKVYIPKSSLRKATFCCS